MAEEHSNNTDLKPLLARVALKDRQAFRQLYDASSSHLLGVLMRITRNQSQAEDALQDAFVQIWNRAGDYNAEKAQPLTWMAAIARYRALDAIRRVEREVSSDPDMEQNIPDPSDEGFAGFEAWDRAKDLQHCLQTLSEEARESIMRAYIEGYSHSELSELTNTPLGTVKSWIRRGLAQLRDCMERMSA